MKLSSRPDLLSRDAAGETWLAAVIAALCFIACLAAIGAAAGERAAHGWAGRLRAEATVQVRPRVDETGAAAAGRAAETLAGLDGVEEAEAMDRATAERLLRPWVGEAALADLPVPHLVTVRLDRDAPASAVVMSRALAEAGLDATVDDHRLWRGEVERSAAVLSALALAVFGLTALAAAAAVVYATRAGLQAQRQAVETLSLSGATDGAIARLFMRRYGLLASGAGAVGALAAAGVAGLLRGVGGEGGLTAALPVAWSDLALVVMCPLLSGAVAAAAAWIGGLTVLGGRRAER
ncbi:FtsX-like permease family protein [Brevundimonas sp. VNH65]|uniref:FtsX-like permease family protein n=1 Tax=Brevundimonas sp. VNH65 TaxID=3400917 RepID=UPI003C0A1635